MELEKLCFFMIPLFERDGCPQFNSPNLHKSASSDVEVVTIVFIVVSLVSAIRPLAEPISWVRRRLFSLKSVIDIEQLRLMLCTNVPSSVFHFFTSVNFLINENRFHRFVVIHRFAFTFSTRIGLTSRVSRCFVGRSECSNGA